jgi:serine/threonine protein kinase
MSTTLINTKRIANFEINELIGSGGMANIYRATQLSLERPVALKVLHRHLTMNDNFITRFEKEAKRAAMLHHEKLVSIIDYGCQDGEYFIAMEYVEGRKSETDDDPNETASSRGGIAYRPGGCQWIALCSRLRSDSPRY